MALGIPRIIHPTDFTSKWLDAFTTGIYEYIYHTLLAAATDKSVAVPAGATHAIIMGSLGGTYMKANAAAVVPASDVFDGTGSMALQNGAPILLQLGPMSDGTVISTLHFISAGTPIVTIAWFKQGQ